MATEKVKRTKLPRSAMNLALRRAVRRLKAMPMVDKIQLLVEAGLMTQPEADAAKLRVLAKEAAAAQEAASQAAATAAAP